jgi:hypothetical protein
MTIEEAIKSARLPGRPWFATEDDWTTDRAFAVRGAFAESITGAAAGVLIEGKQLIRVTEDEAARIPQSEPNYRCPACDGKGMRRCDMGHEHECDDCDGHGTSAHPRVDDLGQIVLVGIDGHRSVCAYRFLALLSLGKAHRVLGGDPTAALLVVVDDAGPVAVFMPMAVKERTP